MRNLRILLLIYLLLFVALGAWLARARTTDWDDTLYVGIYPINGDNSEVSTRYIGALEPGHFADVEEFVKREGLRYGVTYAEPLRIELGQPVADSPPQPPADRNIAGVMYWSLKLRYWAWQQQRQQPGPDPDIRIFLIYNDPAQNPVLAHSLGLQKGLVGVVNAFASRRMAGSNNVVIAHELFHTLGATDKYTPVTNLPLHPHGYAEPLRNPLHPQTFAELMGGRIPLTSTLAETPASLRDVIVGPLTAAEVRWSN
ncbi:MAG: hypothetical protein KJO54_09110 [Gammaproteobacteria bacterium]|nr:hypothetical protein [Gammaproteobacteria bacterium]NNF61044.1 hypothetical protein [Gammaproteobacteria bacterium]NNM21443.1 hypothetical protein [Gammaproteobacteria bacterium]